MDGGFGGGGDDEDEGEGEEVGGGGFASGESSALGAVVFDDCDGFVSVLLHRIVFDITCLLFDRVCACLLHAAVASCRTPG